MSTGTVRLVLRERAVPPHVLRGLRSPGQLQQYAAVSVSRCAQSCTKWIPASTFCRMYVHRVSKTSHLWLAIISTHMVRLR